MEISTHWNTHNLLQKGILACAASLIYFGIIEYGTTFSLTQWVSWLFFTILFLTTMILIPKFIRPTKRRSKIMSLLYMPALVVITLFACWWLELNLLQTAAYGISTAILLLGMGLHSFTKATQTAADATVHNAQTEQG